MSSAILGIAILLAVALIAGLVLMRLRPKPTWSVTHDASRSSISDPVVHSAAVHHHDHGSVSASSDAISHGGIDGGGSAAP